MKLPTMEDLRLKYAEQSQDGDGKKYLTLSNLKFGEGKNQLALRNYRAAQIKFHESVKAAVDNQKILNEFSDEANRKTYIKKARAHAVERLAYFFAAYARCMNIDITKNKKDLLKKASRDGKLKFKNYSLANKDIEEALEIGVIVYLSEINSRDLNLSIIESYLSSDYLPNIDSIKLSTLRRKTVYNLINNQKAGRRINVDAATDISKAYAFLANEYLAISDKVRYSDAQLESLKYMCLASPDIKTLRIGLNKMVKFLHDSDFELTPGEKKRKEGLESVFVLSRGLQITDSLQEKIKISNEILDAYKVARHYNRQRFNVYAEWLKISDYILKGHFGTEKDIKDLLHNIKIRKVADYTDRDENWLIDNMPQIINARANIQTIRKYLKGLFDKEEHFTGSPELNSSLYLYCSDWLNLDACMALLKKYISKELELTQTPEPLTLSEDKREFNGQVPDKAHLERIWNGESNTTELKASWKFDTKERTSSKVVESSALRAIAAFLNTNGGILYIGVNDNREIIGLEETDFRIIKVKDTYKKLDKLRLIIDNAIRSKLGNSQLHNVRISNQVSDTGKNYLAIEVSKSSSEVFLEGTFYIRGSASSNPLNGRELVEYCRERFK